MCRILGPAPVANMDACKWAGSRLAALDPILAQVTLARFERQPTHLEGANAPSGRNTLVEYSPLLFVKNMIVGDITYLPTIYVPPDATRA